MPRVFLSYALTDRAFSAELEKALTDRGAQVVDAQRDVDSGEKWETAMLSQLKKSDLLVFVVPRYEGEGKSALFELGAARALGKRIVSVVTDEMRRANNDVASVLGHTYSLGASGRSLDILADRLLSESAAA